jgi:hypothetical protein
MIRTTFKSGMWIGSTLLNSKLYKSVKRKGLWYYRLFISEDFAKTMGDIYDMNVLERKLKGLSKLKKRVFNVDDNGNIWDPSTGEIFGNVNTLKETPNAPKTEPKADKVPAWDFDQTVGELIVKHYEHETASEILAAVCEELAEKYAYHTSEGDEDQIRDMINEYTDSLR